MPGLKRAVPVLLVLLGSVLLGLLGIIGIGPIFSHPLLAVVALVAVCVLGGAAKWRAQEYLLQRPWLWSTTLGAARRYQVRWEQEHVSDNLRGGPEERWRE